MNETFNLSIIGDKAGEVSQLSYMDVDVTSSLGYDYSIGFIFNHPHGPYIKIDTETRQDFSAKGTEQQAQDALISLTQEMRLRSGGIISVHPFHGAVWGTVLTPVAEGFLTSNPRADEDLTMFIYLSDAGNRFDNKLTKKAEAIGNFILFPGPKVADFMQYSSAYMANPNQADRDQAITNGLKKQWEAQFKAVNNFKGVPPAMVLNGFNIVQFLGGLKADGVFTNIKLADYTLAKEG